MIRGTRTLRVYFYGYGGRGPSKIPNHGAMSWDTLGYIVVSIWNHPRPLETLFGSKHVGRGGRHIPGSSSLVRFEHRMD